MHRVRLANEDDLPAMLALSNEAAATSAVNFAVRPERLEDWSADFGRTREMYPWIVAQDAQGELSGFARASPWKGRCAYAHTVEITVYVRPDRQRAGVGTALYSRLLAILRAQGYRTALGGIAQPNEPSVRLHERFGMRRTALLERVGWKLGRWHDVGYWQIDLQGGDEPPRALRPVREADPGENPPSIEHWSDPERVEKFAQREPDERLQRLARGYADPSAVRALDLGCAGGRNAVFLARSGFDVWALDASQAMVERTREAVRPYLEEPRAREQVVCGRMDDLSFLDEGSVQLVVALGIYHMARDEAELHAALAETARILAPGGRVLASVFGPGTRLGGRPLAPVPGATPVHSDPDGGTVCLLTAERLDTAMRRHGLEPETPTETVVREAEDSRRVVANGLYRKRADARRPA